MLNNIVIGRYINIDSKIHKLNPFIKILSLIIFVIMVFPIKKIELELIPLILIAILILISNINPKIYLKSIYSIRYIVITLTLISIMSKLSTSIIIMSSLKIILLVLYSTILTLTTKPSELTEGIETLLKPFKKIMPVEDITFILANSLVFIPILIDEINDQLTPQMPYISDKKLKNIKGIIIPLIGNSISNMDKFILSLELKGYPYKNKKETKKIIDEDICFLILHIICLIGVIIL